MTTVVVAVIGVALFMMMPLVVICAALGFWIGGGVGAVIGALIGAAMSGAFS